MQNVLTKETVNNTIVYFPGDKAVAICTHKLPSIVTHSPYTHSWTTKEKEGTVGIFPYSIPACSL